MLIGSTLKCWYRRLTQLQSTPITRHGKQRRRSLLPAERRRTRSSENVNQRHRKPFKKVTHATATIRKLTKKLTQNATIESTVKHQTRIRGGYI